MTPRTDKRLPQLEETPLLQTTATEEIPHQEAETHPVEEKILSPEETILAGEAVILLEEEEILSQEGEVDPSAQEETVTHQEEEETLQVEEEIPSLEAEALTIFPHSLQHLRQAEEGMDHQEVEEEFFMLLGRAATETSGIYGNTYPTVLMYLLSKLN